MGDIGRFAAAAAAANIQAARRRRRAQCMEGAGATRAVARVSPREVRQPWLEPAADGWPRCLLAAAAASNCRICKRAGWPLQPMATAIVTRWRKPGGSIRGQRSPSAFNRIVILQLSGRASL